MFLIPIQQQDLLTIHSCHDSIIFTVSIRVNCLAVPQVGLYHPLSGTCQYIAIPSARQVQLSNLYLYALYNRMTGAQAQPWVMVLHSSNRWPVTRLRCIIHFRRVRVSVGSFADFCATLTIENVHDHSAFVAPLDTVEGGDPPFLAQERW